MLWCCLVMASDGVEVARIPEEEPQPISRPVSCGKEPVSEPRKNHPKSARRPGKNLESVGFQQNQQPPNLKGRGPNVHSLFTRVPRARIAVKPPAQMLNLARLHQAAILNANNLVSRFGPMKLVLRSLSTCSILLFLPFFRPFRSPKGKIWQKKRQYHTTLIYSLKKLIDLSRNISNARAFRSIQTWTGDS